MKVKTWFVVLSVMIFTLLAASCTQNSGRGEDSGGFLNAPGSLFGGKDGNAGLNSGDGGFLVTITPGPGQPAGYSYDGGDENSGVAGNGNGNGNGNANGNGKGQGNGKGNDKEKGKDKEKDGGDKKNQYDDLALDASLLPLSALDGAVVVNRGGNQIGVIDSVIVDENSGQAPYLLYDAQNGKAEDKKGNDKLVPVPLSAFDQASAIRPEKKKDNFDGKVVLVFNRDEKQLKDAPAFDQNEDLAGRMSAVRGYWQGEGATIPMSGEGDAVRRARDGAPEDLALYDRGGARIGQVIDFVVDRGTGETRYFLVSLDGRENEGYLVLPASAFSREGLSADQRGFVLTAEQAAIDRAPRVQYGQ